MSRFLRNFFKFSKYLFGVTTASATAYGAWTMYTQYNIDYPTFQRIELPNRINNATDESNKYEIRRYPPLPIAAAYEKSTSYVEALFLGKQEMLLFLDDRQNTRRKKIPYHNFISCQKLEGIIVEPPWKAFEVWMTLRHDDPFVGKSWNPYISVKEDFPGYRASKKFRGKLTNQLIEQEAEIFLSELEKDNIIVTNHLFRVVNYTQNIIPYFCLNEIEYEIEKPSNNSNNNNH